MYHVTITGKIPYLHVYLTAVFVNHYTEFARVTREKSCSTTPDPCTSKSSHVNYKFLSSPQKVERMQQLKTENTELKRKVSKLESKINDIICK